MYSPMICWAGRWIGIPELSLKKLATRIVEAARVGHSCGVGTAQREIEAVL